MNVLSNNLDLKIVIILNIEQWMEHSEFEIGDLVWVKTCIQGRLTVSSRMSAIMNVLMMVQVIENLTMYIFNSRFQLP